MRDRTYSELALAALVIAVAVAPLQDTSRLGARNPAAQAGIRYLYLIRHGAYDEDDPRDPRVGKGLDSLGRDQARLTGGRLAHLPIRIDRLVSSTFTRAAETADIIGKSLHVPVTRDSDVCECSAPSYRPDYVRVDSRAEKEACRTRLERAYRRYVRPAGGPDDRHDVIVSHGNVIRWFVTKALGLPTTRWPDYDIGNCSITVISVRPNGATRLDAFSDTGHLPASLQTWTGKGAGWTSAKR